MLKVQGERLDEAKLVQLLERHQAVQTRDAARTKVAEWHASLRPEPASEAVEHIRKWMDRYGDY
ncbi:MAG: hypothetical protein U0231_04130 [Nitrospiraceae bacterium]